jgi:hypothetical protein
MQLEGEDRDYENAGMYPNAMARVAVVRWSAVVPEPYM